MRISVCMATYNGGKYLKEQLDSILSQLSMNDELIISDDGSTDETLAIARSYTDPRIKIYHSECKSPIYNFENALKQAAGDIIILSDQDDIWMDQKVEKTLRTLKTNLLTFSNAIILENATGRSQDLLYTSKDLTGFFKNLVKNNYIGATMAFRASLLQVALPFPKNLPMHDMWLGLLAEIHGSTAYLSEPLIYYRRHFGNVSTTGARSRNSLLRKITLRLRISTQLLMRSLSKSIATELRTDI